MPTSPPSTAAVSSGKDQLVKRSPFGIRLGLFVRAALLALPHAPTTSSVEAKKKRLRTVTTVFDSGGSWSVGQS
jgi:hypothetical protein